MVIIITGASHIGKTYIAQKLLEKYNYPYLSIDHLKMGLIRSNNTSLSPLSDTNDLINYLWPIVSEIIKTNIENKQNIIIEGCYVPFDWKNYFDDYYLNNINCYFVVMSTKYIQNNYHDIMKYANIIENRLEDDLSIDELINDNNYILQNCIKNNLNYILIDDCYNVDTIIEGMYEKK